MALVEVYFDESGTHDTAKSLCVAGYIFESEKAAALDLEWRIMLEKYGLPYFHMSECAHNVGIYAHLSEKQCDLSAREAIGLIKKYASMGVVTSIEVAHFHMVPTGNLFDSAYTFACWFSLMGVRHWANKNNYLDDVAYFFESGAEHEGEAGRFMQGVRNIPDLKSQYRFSSLSFLEKDKATPLQCADILAWQWGTHLRRLGDGEKMRKDLESLAEIETNAIHFNKSQIEELAASSNARIEEEAMKSLTIPGYAPYDDYRVPR